LKHIVHIIDNLKTGGAEILLAAVIRKLPGFSHTIITLTPHIELTEIAGLAEIHCIHHKGWHMLPRSCRRIQRLVRQANPQVVHVHLFLSALLSRLALGTRYNLVYSLHNLYSATIFKKPWQRLLEKAVYNPQHKLIAVSSYVLHDYQRVVTACKSGTVLYNFIDDAFFSHGVLKKFPPPSLHKWVAVGSMKAQKNYKGLINSFKHFYNEHPQKNPLRLDIYGDGPLRESIQAQLSGSALPIHLKGNMTNIASLLKEYDAYISASHYEGYGIAPMEALAVGLPIFLSDIPVYREIYGGHAFFFNAAEQDARTFSKAHTLYQSMTTGEKEAHLAAGRQYAAAVAGSESYLKKLLTIYGIEAA
jgi:glycosyltransferase involved in cell wall biosynthesis